MLIKYWKDPVWSKVIAFVITSVFTAMFYLIYNNIPDKKIESAMSWLFSNISVPHWSIVVFLIMFLLLMIITFSKSSKKVKELNSSEWFELIIEKLSDCNEAKLYLRSFDHPDNFRDEHRVTLMKIMKILAKKIESGSSIKVISYAENSESKTGYDWILSELNGAKEVETSIKVIRSQPVYNTTSMYLFDDKSVVYNKRSNGKFTYHVENYSTSILHKLLSLGHESLEKAVQ